MKYSTYIVSSNPLEKESLTWREPFAWDKDGNGTHFTNHKAFISEKKILGGYRYCVRACTMRIQPPEEPQ